jgi:YD repeat-containing protein
MTCGSSYTKFRTLPLSSIKYDSHSRPLTVTDPRGRATTFVYDGFGDAIQQNSPDTLKTIFYYDPDSNLTGQNQSGINFSSATYDALDRLLTRTYSADSTLNVSNTYDQAGHGFGIGRLTSDTDQVGSLSRSYDERGNITTDARTIVSQLYSNAYTYDSAGRYSSITYASSGWKVAYTRDSAGQITAVTDTQPGHGAVNLATSVTHMPFGPVASLTWGNGVTDARTFDLDYRMTSITDHGTSNIQYLSYGYDAGNNVTSNTDHVTPADNQTFHYDLLSRISFASGPYGTVSGITYDSNSNRLAYGATAYTIPGSSNRMNKAGASSITYISTGNISAIGAAPFTYYKSNQLATAKPGTATSTFWYDAFGNRLKVKLATSGNPFRVEIYDLNGHLLTQTSGSTIVETDYAYLDDMPLSVIAPAAATISALHTDNIGTVQRATNSAKTVVWTGNYDPNGAVTPTTSIIMNLRQLGVLSDVSGDYHNGFRDRVPGTIPGYLQSDPLGLAPWIMSPTSQGNPNTYPWLGYNPYKNTDPSGLIFVVDDAIEFAVAAEAVEALSAGVAEVADALEASEAAEAAQAAADRQAAEDAARAARDLARLLPRPQQAETGEQCTAAQGGGTGTALSPLRYSQPGEAFLRYETGNPDFSRVTPSGGLQPGTFAAPSSEGVQPQSSLNGLYNLPNPELPRTTLFEIAPPPGTPVIGPRPVSGGTGNEVIFPYCAPPGSVR